MDVNAKEDEAHCHRSLLRQLLIDKGAQVV